MSHVSAPSLGTLPACVVELWDAPKGVENSFDDVDALATQCRFRDCRQESEPACAVSAAVERGDLDAGRPANALIVMSMQTLTSALGQNCSLGMAAASQTSTQFQLGKAGLLLSFRGIGVRFAYVGAAPARLRIIRPSEELPIKSSNCATQPIP
jgi:hypothetical protein